jgi:hypothetical protein
LPATFVFAATFETPTDTPAVGVEQPGSKFALSALPSRGVATKEQVDALKSGKWIFYFYGKITYDAVFRTPHKTTGRNGGESGIQDMDSTGCRALGF